MTGPFTPRKMSLILLAIIAFAVTPVLSVAASLGIAGAYGCKLNEASTYPCLVGGFDLGELLATMFVAGWFGLMTVPLGTIALLVWILAAIVLYVRHKRAVQDKIDV